MLSVGISAGHEITSSSRIERGRERHKETKNRTESGGRMCGRRTDYYEGRRRAKFQQGLTFRILFSLRCIHRTVLLSPSPSFFPVTVAATVHSRPGKLP